MVNHSPARRSKVKAKPKRLRRPAVNNPAVNNPVSRYRRDSAPAFALMRIREK